MTLVLLADHHVQARSALKTLLQEETGFEVIGETDCAETLLELAARRIPDLVLMDWQLPGQPVERVIAGLHALEPKPKVIVMSSNPDDSRRLLRAGADAFLSKADQPDWLRETLQRLAQKNG